MSIFKQELISVNKLQSIVSKQELIDEEVSISMDVSVVLLTLLSVTHITLLLTLQNFQHFY